MAARKGLDLPVVTLGIGHAPSMAEAWHEAVPQRESKEQVHVATDDGGDLVGAAALTAAPAARAQDQSLVLNFGGFVRAASTPALMAMC